MLECGHFYHDCNHWHMHFLLQNNVLYYIENYKIVIEKNQLALFLVKHKSIFFYHHSNQFIHFKQFSDLNHFYHIVSYLYNASKD